MGSKHYIDAHMRLHADAVHIWRADLDAVGPQIEGLLDERERERAERIVREPVRQRWMAARGVLRVLVGAYVDEHPSALRFAQEARGKPMLDLPGGGRLRFNLSHSYGLAVYALTEMCAVGVDVELVARHSNARAHRPDFLRAWVRHEAEGKRLGVGVRNTPVQARYRSSPPWLAELDLGRDAVGAVALARAPVDFQVYAIDFRASGSILPAGANTTHEDEPSVSK
jgi:phosphopantetheinyl transferase